MGCPPRLDLHLLLEDLQPGGARVGAQQLAQQRGGRRQLLVKLLLHARLQNETARRAHSDAITRVA
eukprot:1360722-Pleurochrysis_carterae.AAC.1